jgi:hypothetical protein
MEFQSVADFQMIHSSLCNVVSDRFWAYEKPIVQAAGAPFPGAMPHSRPSGIRV